MSSWRIREIEREIEELKDGLYHCDSEKERYHIQRKIDNLRDELRRLKRIEEEEDDDGLLGIGISLMGIGLGGFGSGGGGGSHGFGGGSFGGGGSGGDW